MARSCRNEKTSISAIRKSTPSPHAVSFFPRPIAPASVFVPSIIPGLNAFREKLQHLSPSLTVGKLNCPDGLNWIFHALNFLSQCDDGVLSEDGCSQKAREARCVFAQKEEDGEEV